MSPRPRVPLRHCPLCGIAMQANKPDVRLTGFDRFDCLSCGTTIEVPQPTQDDDGDGTPDGE